MFPALEEDREGYSEMALRVILSLLPLPGSSSFRRVLFHSVLVHYTNEGKSVNATEGEHCIKCDATTGNDNCGEKQESKVVLALNALLEETTETRLGEIYQKKFLDITIGGGAGGDGGGGSSGGDGGGSSSSSSSTVAIVAATAATAAAMVAATSKTLAQGTGELLRRLSCLLACSTGLGGGGNNRNVEFEGTGDPSGDKSEVCRGRIDSNNTAVKAQGPPAWRSSRGVEESAESGCSEGG
ncbi:hypothetical protein HZH68_003028 [Vespula germanica]|uniref:Uncharacterized protein n=1 Tax=Vespula germanica TaxID=30212 RepID=A0A834U2D1_VESGE|nr:hypothetical protein HZH68_003028 [Vespula germanica]